MTAVLIDPKYCSRSLSALTEEEKYMEVFWEKAKFGIDLFDVDLQLAKEHNLNISRIIRFKFHEWLQSKIILDEAMS
jgi:hypothetical protein